MNDVKAIRCSFLQRLKPRTVRSEGGMAENSAEKVAFVTSGAKARIQMKELTAALEALHPSKPKPGLLGTPTLRHPKPEFFSSLGAMPCPNPVYETRYRESR